MCCWENLIQLALERQEFSFLHLLSLVPSKVLKFGGAQLAVGRVPSMLQLLVEV